MNVSSLLMLGLGLFALCIGVTVLVRRGVDEAARYHRRIAGTMAAALGLFLMIFALGLGLTSPQPLSAQGE